MLIEFEGSQFCGGTLVAPTEVLTAAHCVESAGDVSALRVIGGRTRVDGTDGTVREVASARLDSRYGGPGSAYDAAVLTLDRPMPYRTIPVAGPGDASWWPTPPCSAGDAQGRASPEPASSRPSSSSPPSPTPGLTPTPRPTRP
jgi:hypothetical protein